MSRAVRTPRSEANAASRSPIATRIFSAETVRVGGNHAQPAPLRLEEHSREDRPGVVGRCRHRYLPDGCGECRPVDGHGTLEIRLAELWKIIGGKLTEAEHRTSPADLDLASLGLERHRTRGQLAHRFGGEAGGSHRRAPGGPLHPP